MSRRCYIAGAGEFDENTLPESGDYIIAADGGYKSLTSRGITPDLVVGDFDSLPADLLEAVSKHPNVVRCPVEKDDTDMMLAVRQGLKRGYETFIINGSLGGRLDQTLANIQILVYIAEKNARGTLVGHEICITTVRNGEIKFARAMPKGCVVSVFSAAGAAEGVTLKGLKYPLDNTTVTSSYPIGVSNEFTGEPAVISVKNGILIILIAAPMRLLLYPS